MIIFCSYFQGISQTEELKYVPSESEKRKGTKPKQLEGMEGSVEKVVVLTQTQSTLELDIHFKGYSGKHLKILALSKSGNPKLEIIPFAKKVSSGKERIKARLKLMSSKETSSGFIELIFTNGMLRFKGISYVFELNKNWSSKTSSSEDSSTSTPPRIVERTPQTIELRLTPLEKTRRTFIHN